jgi:acetyl esterase/lipase
MLMGAVTNAATVYLDSVFEVERTNDIVYATGDVGNPVSGQMDLLLDLYLPKGENLPEKVPGLVVVHGGGFVGGDKGVANFVRWCEDYAKRGYVAVSINYRLRDDDPTAEPGPVPNDTQRLRAINAGTQDAAKAVRWMRDNSEKYGIDPTRIAIGGGSAGGYISLFAGYQESTTIGPDAEVSAIVDLWGGMLGSEELIDPDDPPVFIVHGTADPTVPISEAYNLRDRLIEVDIPYGWFLQEGGGHGVWNYFFNTTVSGKRVERHCAEFLFTHMDLMRIHPATEDLPGIITVNPGNSNAMWSIPTESGFLYRIEQSTDMTSWQPSHVPDFQGTGSPMEVQLPTTGEEAFYRVTIQPVF